MEDKAYSSKLFPFDDEEKDKQLTKFLEEIQVVVDLDMLDRDPYIRILIIELSKSPNNEIIRRELSERLKPYIIRERLKPSIFKIPPED